MTKNTLVTGGLGFIGSHLVERLLNEGHSVTIIDNEATGKLENISSFRDNPRLKAIEADVSQLDTLAPHFERIDWVFHLAALASIVPSIEQPLDYYKANVTGTVNVMEAARASGVSRVIYGASSSCYGMPDNFPTSETAPAQPQYPYALTKHLGEQIVLHWGRVYGIGTASLRFFNVYGPRARTTGAYGAVLGVFLAQRLANESLTIVGDGTQTRDFTYVTDVADALVRAAQGDVSGEVFNVGSGGTYSVNYLAELVGGPTVHIPKRPGEPDCTFADIAKIRSILKWEPSVRFEQGVRLVLERISDWDKAPVWTPESIAESTRAWFHHLGKEEAIR